MKQEVVRRRKKASYFFILFIVLAIIFFVVGLKGISPLLAVSVSVPDACKTVNHSDTSRWDTCIENVALQTKDFTVCTAATDANYCRISYAVAKKDWGVCGTIPNSPTTNKCYFSAAVATQDPTYCTKIELIFNDLPDEEKTLRKQQECLENYQRFKLYGVNTCGRGEDRFDCCGDATFSNRESICVGNQS